VKIQLQRWEIDLESAWQSEDLKKIAPWRRLNLAAMRAK
jgi:hypothetical protein